MAIILHYFAEFGSIRDRLRKSSLSGPSLPVPVELVSGDVFIVAPEYVDAPEC